MPKKAKAKQMPSDFYNMEAFNEKDKKINMKEVFGKNAPKKTNKQTTKKKTTKKIKQERAPNGSNKQGLKNNKEKIKY